MLQLKSRQGIPGSKKSKRPSIVRSPERLRGLLKAEFENPRRAYWLFDKFLQHKLYSRNFCLELLKIGRGDAGDKWDIRRLATLMIEHQLLKLAIENVDEFDFIFTRLQLKSARGVDVKLNESVLKEGYSTTDICGFIPEFRRKLERLIRIHERIKGRRSADGALRDFISASSRDCKLSVARYLFRPEEVVEKILQQVKVGSGVKDVDPSEPTYVDDEAEYVMSHMPDYEARILDRLFRTADIYWVSEATSSRLNSLVEYPLTTVVLVIKPPGSHLEFEIKRAGRRGPNKLSVVFWRNNFSVPTPHRLDGGSMQWLLRWEAKAASRLAIIYRLVHGEEMPMPTYISRASIYSVPVHDAEADILDYFTNPQTFGKGFEDMRAAMQEAVDAFKNEHYWNPSDLPGELGLTATFFGQAAPGQAIIAGTSSFRLDQLAAYLSGGGPEKYFKDGLQASYSEQDERWLADEILEEVLGVYIQPTSSYRNYKQYVEEAFSMAANRAMADHNYLCAMRQIGNFWGTILGTGGCSWGESFVGRNVGLKSCWEQGQWKVKIIFMDHDNLHVADESVNSFYPPNALPGMMMDERYICGGPRGKFFELCEVHFLENIYRIGNGVRKKGRTLFRQSLREAYRRTLDALATNPKLGRFFHKSFIDRIRVWDMLVGGYFATKDDPARFAAWTEEMQKLLSEKGYKPTAFDSYLKAIDEHLDYLTRYRFLY